ncbi:putative integrases/recombinase [Phaeobacter inhibens]|uniref:recombinase family protein n=2 Tax=Roseobacteraceae TaxID=2854170 RepID=UPI000C9A6208|nr:recombinase family protein [Phaeobacter inhibens]AUR03432.1 putative integrases/recombinase [Phaeobacter inhibens]
MSYPFGQDFPGTQLNAILYARVSSAEQAKSDLSIPDQMESMRKHCRQAGITVAHEFSDARSGRSLDGRSLGEILDIIKSGTVTINLLIVHSFSRLARESYEAEWLWRELEKLGVQIVSITQPIEDSPTGGLLRQMINVFDEYTSNEIAKHVTRTMKFNAEHGFWNGGLPPFGYVAAVAGMRGKKVKKKLAVDPNEAEDVRLIFTLYLDGDGKTGPMGVKKVAQWMNSHGHSRRGRNWTTGQLHRLLTDAVYVGDYLFGKKKPKDSQVIVKVPAIIDAPTFDKVQARLREHHPILKAPRQVSSPVLLTGIARCGHCGGGMVLATGKSNRYRYYTCSNHKRKGKSVCQGQNVPMEELDKIVTDALILALDDTERSQAVLEALNQRMDARDVDEKSRTAELRRVLKDKEQAVTRLFQGVEKGLFDLDDELFQVQYQTARSERDIIKGKIEALTRNRSMRMHMSPEKVAQFGHFLSEVLLAGPVGFRKRYIQAFLDSVVVKDRVINIIARENSPQINIDCGKSPEKLM